MAVNEKANNEIIRRPAAVPVVKQGAGMWAWLLQRVTAVLLFVALGAHTWVLHYKNVGEKITFQGVVDRFGSPWLVAMDVSLLTLGVYHALNGVRSVIFDFGISERSQKIVTWGLVVVGAVALLFGINTLLMFLRGSPFLW